jgi:hypothetical protein
MRTPIEIFTWNVLGSFDVKRQILTRHSAILSAA